MTQAFPALPAWPTLMDDALASAYLDMGVSSFRAIMVRNGVHPVETGLRLTRWRKRDLDALVDSLPARDQPTSDGAAAPALQALAQIDPAEAALAAARKRRSRNG